MKKLEEAAERINKLSDELSKRIIEEENKLKSLNIGLNVWIPCGNSLTTKIGYRKWDKKWKIVIEYEEFGEKIQNILSDSPRELRLFCFKYIKNLPDALYRAALAYEQKLEKVLKGEEEE